jgi:hypothetical protein
VQYEAQFIRLVKAERRHHCSQPNPSSNSHTDTEPKFTYGTIWQCECGRQWKVIRTIQVYSPGSYVAWWRPFPRWYDRLFAALKAG